MPNATPPHQSMAACDQGRVRTSNQDRIWADDQAGLWIVADGMGGHAGGETASQMAVSNLAHHWNTLWPFAADNSGPAGERLLGQGVQRACREIFRKSLSNPNLKGMGTTLTALCRCSPTTLAYAHVGDSRLYLQRGTYLFQLTTDHTMLQPQIDSGELTEQETLTHPLRNVITRSVGFQESELVDTGVLTAEQGDVWLLCSDGLHGKLSGEQLRQHLLAPNPAIAQDLVALANAAGGEDNISVIVIMAEGSGAASSL